MSNLTLQDLFLIFVACYAANTLSVFTINWAANVLNEVRHRQAIFRLEQFDDVLGRIADRAERMKILTDMKEDQDGSPTV